jgi:hypothetical protein
MAAAVVTGSTIQVPTQLARLWFGKYVPSTSYATNGEVVQASQFDPKATEILFMIPFGPTSSGKSVDTNLGTVRIWETYGTEVAAAQDESNEVLFLLVGLLF